LGGVSSAIVLATRPGAATVVAGLSLAVRAVLALREAGFREVALLAPEEPRWAAGPLARRGVSARWLPALQGETSPWPGFGDAPALLLAGDVLVDADAAAALRAASPGSVSTVTGHVVGEVCAAADVATCLDRADSWAQARASRNGIAAPATRIEAGLLVPLAIAGSAGQLERVLVDHLAGRAADSYLATLFDRRLSRPLTRLLLRTPLAPSHVTLLSVAIGLVGAMGLTTGSYWRRLGGVLLLVASLVLDCVDGEMARARLAQSPAGARLDVIGDYIVHLAVFAGLAVGLLRGGLPPAGAWAALALVTGVGAAMVVVHALFIGPALRHGDLHWNGDASSLRGLPGASVVEKLASRDYTYLLLVLAVVGHLEWFLYTAAAGAWVFTAVVVGYAVLAWPRRRREAAAR
jgi:phosphatidylglycerophosphate synthase